MKSFGAQLSPKALAPTSSPLRGEDRGEGEISIMKKSVERSFNQVSEFPESSLLAPYGERIEVRGAGPNTQS